jgi:hypothetical protein
VLVLLFGITSGMTVIWYGAQFYALFILTVRAPGIRM